MSGNRFKKLKPEQVQAAQKLLEQLPLSRSPRLETRSTKTTRVVDVCFTREDGRFARYVVGPVITVLQHKNHTDRYVTVPDSATPTISLAQGARNVHQRLEKALRE